MAVLSGKVFAYLAAERPILAAVPPDGAAAALVRDTGAGVVAAPDDGAARRGEGPGYLEAVTYRWYGHVGPDENIDVGLRRSAAELAAWKLRDPVERLGAAAIARGDFTAGDLSAMQERAVETVDSAIAKALSAPYPETGALFDYVYVNNAR